MVNHTVLYTALAKTAHSFLLIPRPAYMHGIMQYFDGDVYIIRAKLRDIES